MRKFLLRYLLPRILQYFMVIFLGVTLTFIIPRLSPNDPVERQVSHDDEPGVARSAPRRSSTCAQALTEMYGLKGSTVAAVFRLLGPAVPR